MTTTTQAQARATNKYRQKLITKQININPAKHPEVAQFVVNEDYEGAFSPFVIGLIQQHIEQHNIEQQSGQNTDTHNDQ